MEQLLGSLHPAIVHIPIGVLILYSLLEVLSLTPLGRQSYWPRTKAILVIFGVLVAFGALSSGEGAEHIKAVRRDILEVHAFFAGATTWIYGILAGAYAFAWITEYPRIIRILSAKNSVAILYKKIASLVRFILNKWVSAFLAMLGFAALSITGALGGAMVWGHESDPVISFVYHLFF